MKITYKFFLSMLLLCMLLLSACAVKDDSDDEPQTNGESNFTLTATTNEKGNATVSFGVPQEVSKFSITAKTQKSTASIRFTQIKNSEGDDFLEPDGEVLSLGTEFSNSVKTISIPPRSVDRNVSKDFTYSASIQVQSSSGTALSGETVTVSVNGKNDPSLESGPMNLNIFYVGDVGEDADTQSAVRAALNTSRSILSSQASLTLKVQEFSVDGPTTLPSPAVGSSIYQSASASGANPGVNIFIGGNIGGTGLGGGILGFAADIPGPPFPSSRSVTAISIFEGAGPDGSYSEDDTRLLGETIAHEAGHFMGLFHPIDFSGNSVGSVDPLADTPTCSFVTNCLTNAALARNLMYPNPVSDGDGGFIDQNQLTPNQRSVLNRYLAVD